MIVETLEQLPRIPDGEKIVVDVETVSHSDYDHGHAFDGKAKIAGWALATNDQTWYLPVRHRDAITVKQGGNLPADRVAQYMCDLTKNRTVRNHNIKFDQKFWTQEGVKPPRVEDTMVLARLIECDRFQYSLEALARDYLGKKKGTDSVHEWLEGLKNKKNEKTPKDYGLVPIRILGPYAELDARLTYDLGEMLERKLRPEAKQVWETETRLTWWMSHWECKGIPVNVTRIKETWRSCLRRQLQLQQELNEIVGWEFDPSSDSHVTRFLVGDRKVVPKAFTKKMHRPQWNGMALRTLEGDDKTKRAGALIAEFRNLQAFAGSFCEGWLKRVGVDGRMHCDFRIAGTATGRLSCADPNMQNVSPRAENFVEVAPGRVIVAWDYSQIEYRIFGHYTGDPVIVNEYKTNPDADFHGFLAGVLGVDRQFAKQLNFSFLYGMGKEKLLRNLAGILTLKADESDEMREKMRLMAYGAGTSISERAKQLSASEETKLMAERIYANYHSKFPSIRALQKRVRNCIESRGWIKNFFGRVYDLPTEAVHKGPNYLIQGTAADLFKNRLLAMFEELSPRFDFNMVTNVHDSVILDVAADQAREFYEEGTKILEADLGFRLPIKAEGKVSTKTWGTVEKVKGLQDFDAALERSKAAQTRLAGLAKNEWEDQEKSTGRYDFSGTGN